MRVAVLTSNYPSERHALPGRFVHQQVLALAALGHQVHVINVQPLAYRRWNLRQLRCAWRWRLVNYQGISVHEYVVPLPPVIRSLDASLVLPVASQLGKLAGNIDMLHAHFATWAGMLAAHSGLPYVLTEHGSDVVNDRHPERHELYARAYNSARRVLAVSRALAHVIESRYHVHAEVVPNVVEGFEAPRVAPPGYSATALRLVTVGNLVPIKGHARLLQALALCARRGLQVQLQVVGEGPQRSRLIELAHDLGVSSQVIWLGAGSRDQVCAALDAAHAYVCSSDTETFGVAPVEALTRGRPVVTTPCGGPTDYVQDADGVIAADMSAEALAEAIVQLHGKYGQFDADAIVRRAGERYAPQAIAQRLEAVYRAALLPQ